MSCPAVLRCRTILTVVCLFLSVFLLSECKKENTSAYKVIDSGIWTYQEPIEKTFWLDNERVLVVSNKTLAPGGAGPKVMTIWNTKTNKIDFSHKVTNIICVQDKQVFFYVKDDATGKYKNYRGTLDNPKEHHAPGPNMRIDDRFDCDWSPKFSRAKVPYKIKLKDNNYLEITKEARVNDHGGALYYERLDKLPVQLPVHADLSHNYDIRFNQLRNAYFISPTQYFPDDPYFHSLWWLQRDGTITKKPLPIPLPFVKPLSKSLPKWLPRGGFRFFQLHNGYLILSQIGGTKSMRNTGARGLYLLKGQEVENILLGEIHGVSISPDECRAVFIHARNTEEYLSQRKPYKTIKLINFCEGRK